MKYWLMKTEPATYSFGDLQRDRRTEWDGVRNNQAQLFMRQMSKGDLTLIYHSGKDKCIVGVADVVRGAYPDPDSANDKHVLIDVRASKRLPNPIPLSDIKADERFAEFHLVRMSRLSVMPVPANMWKRLTAMGGL